LHHFRNNAMVGLPNGEKTLRIGGPMCNSLDRIPACNGQTDRHLATA